MAPAKKRSSKVEGAASPIAYIIAGPNGAGKTTFAKEFLAQFVKCLEFVNADYLAYGLSPLAPELAAIKAGRLMISRIEGLKDTKKSFGFETTLAGKTYVSLVKELKASGYRIHLYFLWLPRVSISLQRVAQRVRKGGHDIPEETVRRRFKAGLRNLFEIYGPLVDSWSIWDASKRPPVKIASREQNDLKVYQRELYSRLLLKAKKA